ncbi:MAG: DUF262 domain-containing protein [Deltaproteobacteria bacterium]|nr:DUF262 domain-containing protein [Deltaproteobacteria bacterium]
MALGAIDEAWNDDIYEDVESANYESVVVYSRDWTVETIINQISQGNIDLNPKFQRRNAWNDEKRSRLIESLIIGIPIPEIVLAEDPLKKKSFIVIDGKQRLLTIHGFVDPTIGYWDQSELRWLHTRKELNGLTFENLLTDPELHYIFRAFMNSDIRCTVISSYNSPDILYDIFYRLNTGSVPLSTQELRQVLNKGPFADALVQHTNNKIPLHSVLHLSEPDPRLRDIEVVLRSLSFELYGTDYKGNLKDFLNESMRHLKTAWKEDREKVENLLHQFDRATEQAISVLGAERVGRKYVDGKWERRFNKSVFETELYYFWRTPKEKIDKVNKKKFVNEFKELCEHNTDFRKSIEATTKTNENYHTRFSLMKDLFNSAFGLNISDIPVKTAKE